MLEIGITILMIGIAILLIGLAIDYTAIDYFGPPAVVCCTIAFIIMIAGVSANETTPDTIITQPTQSNQETNNVNHYNYCPNCGYNFCESKEN
jgi:hypothetical protein